MFSSLIKLLGKRLAFAIATGIALWLASLVIWFLYLVSLPH